MVHKILRWAIRKVLYSGPNAATNTQVVLEALHQELQERYPEDTRQTLLDHMIGCTKIYERRKQDGT